jgi:hypothetical protein
MLSVNDTKSEQGLFCGVSMVMVEFSLGQNINQWSSQGICHGGIGGTLINILVFLEIIR